MDATVRRIRSAIDLGGLTLREAVRRTWIKMGEHEVMTRAAAITFYALAALVPFLGLVVLIAAHVLPWISRGRNVDPMELLGQLLPHEAATLLGGQLADVQSRPTTGLISFGTAALLWLNSSLFVAVMDSINRIMGVEETRPYWKQRLIAVSMSVLEAVFLILVLASTLLWPQILGFLKLEGVTAFLVSLIHGLSVFTLVLLSFASAMYFAPDAHQRWEWISPGSLLGTLVLVPISFLFRYYVQRWGNYNATYGSLAGVVILTTWIWLCSLILLVAAEFNKVVEDASPYGKGYGERRENAGVRARAAGFLEAFFKRGPIPDPPGRLRSPVFPSPPRPEPPARAIEAGGDGDETDADAGAVDAGS